MSSRASVELDLLGVERDSSCSSSSNTSQFQKFILRQRSFRGMQQAISLIKPEILKSVMASIGDPNARGSSENQKEATPLTIFYNGRVCVFNVPRDKAESILKIALQGSLNKGVELKHTNRIHLIINRDLPIARQKSLQRFLQKRKERLTSVCPYENGGCNDN